MSSTIYVVDLFQHTRVGTIQSFYLRLREGPSSTPIKQDGLNRNKEEIEFVLNST